jgi:hypothetical protein
MAKLPDPFPFKVTFDFSSHSGTSKNQTKGFKTETDRSRWIRENKDNLSNVKKK